MLLVSFVVSFSAVLVPFAFSVCQTVYRPFPRSNNLDFLPVSESAFESALHLIQKMYDKISAEVGNGMRNKQFDLESEQRFEAVMVMSLGFISCDNSEL